jgi:hypothetical protein
MPQRHPISAPITVERLLKVKRAECPPPQFWAEFDSAMQRRRLQALVAKPRLVDRCWHLARPAVLWSVPALGALMIAALAVRPPSPAADQPSARIPVPAPVEVVARVAGPAAPAAAAQVAASPNARTAASDPRFIFDAIPQSAGSPSHFTRVQPVSTLPVDAMRTPGTRYVQDTVGAVRGERIQLVRFNGQINPHF